MKILYNLLLNVVFYIYKCNSVVLPPVGNTYSKTIKFPLFGKQYIETKVIEKKKAIINLQGIINNSGLVEYKIIDEKLYLHIEDNLSSLLKNLRTSYNDLHYDSINDEIILKLRINPLYFNKKIILTREHIN